MPIANQKVGGHTMRMLMIAVMFLIGCQTVTPVEDSHVVCVIPSTYSASMELIDTTCDDTTDDGWDAFSEIVDSHGLICGPVEYQYPDDRYVFVDLDRSNENTTFVITLVDNECESTFVLVILYNGYTDDQR